MTDPLFAPAPGFDQPIAMLKHCHDRIRKQLATLEKLLTHLHNHGASLDTQQAATAVLRYFNQAAHQHHADEEVDLLPMLKQTASGEDAALLNRLMPQILEEHEVMHRVWQSLEQELNAIAAGTGTSLSADNVQRFSALYQAHMEIEEGNIAPMAKRIFSDTQIRQFGDAMRRRRGIAEGEGQ